MREKIVSILRGDNCKANHAFPINRFFMLGFNPEDEAFSKKLDTELIEMEKEGLIRRESNHIYLTESGEKLVSG